MGWEDSMSHDFTPPTPNDLMRSLIRETQRQNEKLDLIRRYTLSIERMLMVWFVCSLPFILVLAMMLFSLLVGANVLESIRNLFRDSDAHQTAKFVDLLLPL